MPFAYTSGDPNNLVGGSNASMTDIQGPFVDLAAYLNSGAIQDIGSALLYVGEVRWMAIASPPTKWLRCDGTAVSRATYSALFTALGGAGSPYGLGDGVNTFNVPDLRGRTAVGSGTGAGGGASGTGRPTGGSALTARSAGGWFGEERHTLAATESGVAAHAHPAGTLATVSLVQPRGGGLVGNNFNSYQAQSGFNAVDGWDTGAARSIAGSTANATAAAAGSSHENMTPSLVLPAYIYAGA